VAVRRRRTDFYDNCRASLTELEDVLDKSCLAADDYRIVAEWLADTLPEVVARLQGEAVAVLPTDAD
jgi:hypothetical protein